MRCGAAVSEPALLDLADHKPPSSHRIGLERAVAQGKSSARQRMDDPRTHAFALIDRIARVGPKVVLADYPVSVQIDHRDICVRTRAQRAFGVQAHTAGRVLADQWNEFVQRQAALVVPVGQNGRQECVETGKARLRLPNAALFAADRAMDVIGRNRVDVSAPNRSPKRLAILRGSAAAG